MYIYYWFIYSHRTCCRNSQWAGWVRFCAVGGGTLVFPGLLGPEGTKNWTIWNILLSNIWKQP